MKPPSDNNFQRENSQLQLGIKKSNNTERSQNYGDFKSNPALGGRKPKKLTTVSTLLRKYITLL